MSRWAPTLRRVLVLVVVGAAWGALLGVVWEWVWTPPSGAAWQGEWYLDPQGLRTEVSATAWFSVVGLAGGLVYGLLGASLARGRELATLLGVAVGSVVACWVMFHVGQLLSPPDPQAVARTAQDLEPIPGQLGLAGAGSNPWPLWFESSAFAALPAGAMVGLIGVFLGSGSPESRASRRKDQQESSVG